VIGLGATRDVTLAEAKDKAERLRVAIRDGAGPATEKQKAREDRRVEAKAIKVPTFAECAKRYIAAHEAGWKNEKHRAQWSSTLETYAYPVIGSMPVDRIRKLSSISARALLFTILTAVRTSETLGATWDEIELTEKLWIIPAERMKADREHRVPLSEPVIELLGQLPRTSRHVFAGAKGKPLSNLAMLMCLRGIRDDGATVHGFRSSFSTWAREQTDYSPRSSRRPLPTPSPTRSLPPMPAPPSSIGAVNSRSSGRGIVGKEASCQLQSGDRGSETAAGPCPDRPFSDCKRQKLSLRARP
jgi:integrase